MADAVADLPFQVTCHAPGLGWSTIAVRVRALFDPHSRVGKREFAQNRISVINWQSAL